MTSGNILLPSTSQYPYVCPVLDTIGPFLGQEIQVPDIKRIISVVDEALQQKAVKEACLDERDVSKLASETKLTQFLKAIMQNLDNLIQRKEAGGKAYLPKELLTTSWRFSSQSKTSEVLAEGSFGVVCKNTYKTGFCDVTKKPREVKEESHNRELAILNSMPGYPDIIQFHGVDIDNNIVFEVASGGDLYDRVEKFDATPPNPANPSNRIRWAKDVLRALNFLRLQRIIHRDIKLENVLLTSREDDDASAKLTDFGLAVQLREEEMSKPPTHKVVGSWIYIAPEYFQKSPNDDSRVQQPVSIKSDEWAYGGMMYALLQGQFLPWDLFVAKRKREQSETTQTFAYEEAHEIFHKYKFQELVNHFVLQAMEDLKKQYEDAPAECSAADTLYAMMLPCLTLDPANRIEIQELHKKYISE